MTMQQAREIRYGATLAIIYRVRVSMGLGTSSVRHRIAYATNLAQRAYGRTLSHG